MELTQEDLLLGLMEECAEIIQAASKCLRFGYDRIYPGYGQNSARLAAECGQVLAIIDALNLNQTVVRRHADYKILAMLKAKAELLAEKK